MASTGNGKPTTPRQMMAIEIPSPLNILLFPVVNVIDEKNYFVQASQSSMRQPDTVPSGKVRNWLAGGARGCSSPSPSVIDPFLSASLFHRLQANGTTRRKKKVVAFSGGFLKYRWLC
jgi:hypothetical protein